MFFTGSECSEKAVCRPGEYFREITMPNPCSDGSEKDYVPSGQKTWDDLEGRPHYEFTIYWLCLSYACTHVV